MTASSWAKDTVIERRLQQVWRNLTCFHPEPLSFLYWPAGFSAVHGFNLMVPERVFRYEPRLLSVLPVSVDYESVALPTELSRPVDKPFIYAHGAGTRNRTADLLITSRSTN